MVVPNKMPTKVAPRRIAIIGEAPGMSEVHWHTCGKCGWGFATQWRDERGWHTTDRCTKCFSTDIVATPTPFVGPSGWLLNKLLAGVGIDRECCFVGNVCQMQPPGNEIGRFKWDGPEMQSGLQQLRSDLAAFEPHFCLLLGNTPLRAFLGTPKVNITDRQGYFFMSDFLSSGGSGYNSGANANGSERSTSQESPAPCISDDYKTHNAAAQIKCLPVLHPAALLREANLTGHTRLYLRRAADESRTDTLEVPVRRIAIALTKAELLDRLAALRRDHSYVDIDIEGGCGMGPACLGFATSPSDAFVVPFYGVDGESIWGEDDEVDLVEACAAVLADPKVPKCIMNALYEMFVIAWTWGVLVRGVVDDLMLLHFESYAELDKALEFQASIYTKQPYWKLTHRQVGGRYVPFHWDGRRATTSEWFTYNGTDCCVTAECRVAADRLLMPKQREHYRTNVSLLAPILYMELRGMRFDVDEAQRRLAATTRRIYALQDKINREAASGRPALAAFYQALHNGPVGDGANANLVAILAGAFCAARRTERRPVTEHYYEPQRWNGRKWCKAGKRIDATQVADRNGEHVGDGAGGREGGAVATTVGCRQEAVGADAVAVDGQAAEGKPTTFEGWITQGAWQGSQPPTLDKADKGATWLKPASKVVNRRCRVEVATFEDVRRFAKDSCKDACKRACAILRAEHEGASRGLTPALRGQLATLLGLSVKLNASGRKKDRVADDGSVARGDEKDANWLLYDCWKLPPQFTRERGNKKTDKLSSDMEALLTIWSKTKDRRALWFLAWRSLDTRRETLMAKCDDDGRIRCGYNIVGTETVRLSCYESPTGSGYNLQTVAERDKDLFVADEGCEFGSVDLRGADSWSIAARAAMQGDTRMLDDLRAGRKIQTIVALCYQFGADRVNKLSAAELDEACRLFDEKQFIYKGCKMVVYGSSYGMGERTMAAQLLERSYKDEGKPVWVEPRLCREIQDKAFFVRYWGVPMWHQDSLRRLKETGSFTTCAGHRRLFYGRKDDHKTLGEYLCEEAQFNTTYATKLGLLKLWTDPENRRPDGSLRVEPLHSVHDSLNPQWCVEDREFARAKILPVWFNNEIYVGTVKLKIPASGSYGANWKHCDAKL